MILVIIYESINLYEFITFLIFSRTICIYDNYYFCFIPKLIIIIFVNNYYNYYYYINYKLFNFLSMDKIYNIFLQQQLNRMKNEKYPHINFVFYILL